MENPIVLRPYECAELFCNREKETKDFIDDLQNGVNVALISPRRYEKTGLIYHVFDELAKKRPSMMLCYCDIYSADDLEGFVKLLSESIVANVKEESLIKKFFSFLAESDLLFRMIPFRGRLR